MPTSYTDQFYTIDPGTAPASGTVLTFTRDTVVDTDDNGLIEPSTSDTWNGVQITSVWDGDTVTVELPGGAQVTYVGVTYYLATGPAVFTPTDGQALQDGTFVSSTFVQSSTNHPVGDFGPTCFTLGTMIETPDGPRAIETLCVGDLVTTLEGGPKPIRYVLRQTVRGCAAHAPIRFAVGALGNDAPLLVSPQHRMLVTGWRAELLFGEEEVLVPAKHLVNGDTIARAPVEKVEYIHLVFDDHELIFGQGIVSESFFPGNALEAIPLGIQQDIFAHMPVLAQGAVEMHKVKRPVLSKAEAALWFA